MLTMIAQEISVRNVTVMNTPSVPDPVTRIADRLRNPFGMDPPCIAGTPVCGYGDPNADFHVIGDHPGIHGGIDTGIPFDESTRGQKILEVLTLVGLLTPERDGTPRPTNTFLSYVHPCPPKAGRHPEPTSYEELDRFFDAELRAVNAHILLPIGKRATDRILAKYTTQRYKVPPSMGDRNATEIRGRGFLVVPAKDPAHWTEDDKNLYRQTIETILASDYRQTKGVATMIG